MTLRSDAQQIQFDDTASLDLSHATMWQPLIIPHKRIVSRQELYARIRELPDSKGVEQPIGSLDAITRACETRELARIAKAGRALVGLGIGLTPSGDDFLGGLFFVAQHLHAAYPGLMPWNQNAIDALLDWARSQTNPISHAILSDHTRGQSVEPLHALVAALLTGKSIDEINAHAQRLFAIGSTSGREIFAGARAGLLTLIPQK